MSYGDPSFSESLPVSKGKVSRVIRYVSHSRLKRVLDVFLSILFLVMILPLFAVVAIILLANKPRQIFEVRPVIGQQGTEFNMFLFYSDPNTSLGRWLRGGGLVALPQLINVLLGQMSFVGPKPLQINDFDRLKNTVSLYMTAKPGLTGLWLVSEERSMGAIAQTRLDRIYIKTGSFLMDLSILLRTPFVLLRLS